MKYLKNFESITKNENTKYFIVKLEHQEMFDRNFNSYEYNNKPTSAYIIFRIDEKINTLEDKYYAAHIMYEYINDENFYDRSREKSNNITSLNINKIKNRIICYTNTYKDAMKNFNLIKNTNKYNL